MKKIEYTENFEQANRIIEGEKAVLSDVSLEFSAAMIKKFNVLK